MVSMRVECHCTLRYMSFFLIYRGRRKEALELSNQLKFNFKILYIFIYLRFLPSYGKKVGFFFVYFLQ